MLFQFFLLLPDLFEKLTGLLTARMDRERVTFFSEPAHHVIVGSDL
jgi:hypothetical protein